MADQVKVLLTREDIEVIRAALNWQAQTMHHQADPFSRIDATMEQRIAWQAEGDAAKNLSIFLANVG